MSAIDEIIGYQKNPDEDFYGMLNCNDHSTTEQIQAEFKVLALQHHPDKNSGDKESELRFQKLKEAKETLCDEARRANYDKWRNSGISISYKNWLAMKESVHQSMHWATPKTQGRMLPDSEKPAAGSSSTGGRLSAGVSNPAHRRASEGGAALYYGTRKSEFGAEANTSEVVNKFRNYEI